MSKSAIWPCVIVATRYSGVYSGACWVAFEEVGVPEGVLGGDIECERFFYTYDRPIGRGDTPDEAYRSLVTALEEGGDG